MGGAKTVTEISKLYKVTEPCVRIWMKKGLPYAIEKVIGIKPRTVIKVEDVENFLNLGIRKNKKA